MASGKDARYSSTVARVLTVDRRRPDAAAISEAASALRGGGIVAFPTETVYGLGARALDDRAVARVFEAKGRPPHHPLIAHVTGQVQARSLARSWPEAASRLADVFWPGPLTLVVERAPHVPAVIAAGGDSIAVRAPAHPVARALISALGEPVAAPSANRYQGLSPTTAAHVLKQLGDSVDLVLDGGPCDVGIESTVVDVRDERPLVLRPGPLDLAALRAVVPDVEPRLELVAAGDARPSPGMDERHYAPDAPLLLAPTLEEGHRMAFALARDGVRVGLVVRVSTAPRRSRGRKLQVSTASPEDRVLVRVLPHDPAQYARSLYGTLHALDDAGVDVIVVQSVPGDEAWSAVADRLKKGAAPAGRCGAAGPSGVNGRQRAQS